jgi:hypothetical protein
MPHSARSLEWKTEIKQAGARADKCHFLYPICQIKPNITYSFLYPLTILFTRRSVCLVSLSSAEHKKEKPTSTKAITKFLSVFQIKISVGDFTNINKPLWIDHWIETRRDTTNEIYLYLALTSFQYHIWPFHGNIVNSVFTNELYKLCYRNVL